jgi:hypothetical protein
MTTRSNRNDGGDRPKAGEVTGQKSFWFLLGRLPKETRRASEATAKAFDFIREADQPSAFDFPVQEQQMH